jgi:hypothetical protein
MANNENHSDKAASNGNGAVQKVMEVEAGNFSFFSHLESIDRLLSIPSVSLAFNQSTAAYGRVRGKFKLRINKAFWDYSGSCDWFTSTTRFFFLKRN